MYCPYCGFKFGVLPNFCSSCGKNLQVLQETQQKSIQPKPTDVTGKGSDSTLSQFLEYRKLKAGERTNFPLGKKCGSRKAERKVQVNIGIMSLHNGCLKPHRGRTIQLLTDRLVNASETLIMAEKKFKDFNKNMEEGPYVLLYPDGSEVINVPGTSRPFTLKDYKTEIGKPYARINLFLCRRKDFEGEQEVSSESDREVIIRTQNPERSNVADTLPIIPVHTSTPEKSMDNKIDCAPGSEVQIILSDTEDGQPGTSDHVTAENHCYRPSATQNGHVQEMYTTGTTQGPVLSCGKNLQVLQETLQKSIQPKPTDVTGKGMDSTPVSTLSQFLEYRKLKAGERTNFPLGKKCGSRKAERKVQVNIGIMSLHNGCLKPHRGRTIQLLTDRLVNASETLIMAEKKFKDFNKNMEEGPYVLLYPDGSEVINVPGTSRPFTLKDYKTEIGKPYARINLFLCRRKDFEGEQEVSSESDRDVIIRTQNPERSNLADTLPIIPVHTSTPEKSMDNKIDCASGSEVQIILSDTEDGQPGTSDHVTAENHCYSSCGKNLQVLQETQQKSIQPKPTDITGKGSDSTPVSTLSQFLEYRKLKAGERTNFPLGKKCGSRKAEKKVQVNIGLMSLHNGCIKPHRGRTIQLFTNPLVNASETLIMAEKKFKDFIKNMEEGPYVLLYPDGSEVINVPGTSRPFTLKDYKKEIGKPYSRINLFLCRRKDFEGKQEVSSESDREVIIRTQNPERSNLADTLPIIPGHTSTPEKSMDNKIDCASGSEVQIILSDTEDGQPGTSNHVTAENHCYSKMEEADLFMECEEEELEPWQQMNRDELFDSPDTDESMPVGAVTPPVSKPVVFSSISSVSTNMNTVPLFTNPSLPAGISKGTPGQQLFLTQGARGLTPVALSQVILPCTSSGASAGSSQPIYLTTQGIPVQNIQSGQSPLSIVLNVQQGQTVRPITLVQAPGTPGLFKPAVGTTQIITPQSQIRSIAPVVNRGQMPGSFTAMQIPATLTIQNTVPANQPRAMSVPSAQLSTELKPLPINTQTKIVAVRPGGSNLDMQNLMNIVNTVNIAPGSQPQTIVVMSNQKANGSSPAAIQTALPVAQSNIVEGTSVTPLSFACPRCGAQFKMLEALRGHMCFCCPDMTHKTVKREAPKRVEQKQSGPLMKVKTEGIMNPGEHQSRIVMLVDDFYYGTYEGNREYVPTDNVKETLSFRCFTCGKKQKNNIRLMNHMKLHVDMEQQNGEHTSCPHCYRQFPTPFRLQCHVESVHCNLESTTRCKICEWSFESEPVFLQHMKNTHKPGEMPYVCQLCQYRSSFYSDVHSHFCTWHEDTRYLLCIYCLKVFKNSGTYQQHFARHQKTSVYHCNKCRLQFLFTKEKVDHKVNHHKTFRKPSTLEGLQAGTKVTIRACAVHKKTTGLTGHKTIKDTERHISTTQPNQTATEQKPVVAQSSGPAKKQITKMYGFLTKFQEYRALLGRQRCVECTFDIPDFANHYPTYVHCSLCTYSTCCSRAYANHMINNHVSSRTHKARTKKGSLSWLKLTCVWCNYKTTQGDLMAKHLAQFPNHSRCVFSLKECLETDIEFCQVEEEEEEEKVEGANDVEAKPDWLSMENWSVPSDGGSVPEFTDSSGPQHSMSKSSDVLEYFQLLFPDILMEQIAKETNAYAEYQRYVGRGDPTWQSLTSEEVKGFIGLSILMGLQVLPEPDMYWSWKHYHGCSTFYRTMSVERFKQVSLHIRMNSMLEKEDHQNGDKLSFFQPMLKTLETSMRKAYKPNKCLTIDRTLLRSHENAADREKCRNSQPQIWLLCDSKSGYCHKMLILTKQKKNKDLGSLVVPYLVKGLESRHHQIFMSSLLASIPLMKELHKKNIYCSSSSSTCSTVLPREFWDQPALKNTGDYVQFEHPPVLVTRWKDAKEMVCISTNAVAGQPDKVWRRSTSKPGELATISRPLVFKLLQDNMRGVDICSQLLACNQLGGLVLDTNWRRLFWFFVNLSIINSFIVLRETRKGNPPTWLQGGHFSQANYRKRLGYQLAKCAERQALQKEMNSDQLHQQRHEGNPEIGSMEPTRQHTPAMQDTITPTNFSSSLALEDTSGINEDIDQELAPLGSSDSEMETDDSSQQEPVEIRDEHKGKESAAKPNSPISIKETEDMLSAHQLRIILFALCSGIQKAAKDMGTEPQLIRTWLQDKEKRLDCESQDSSSGEAVEHLVEWVLVQREQQHPIREENLFQKASEIHNQINPNSSFCISYDWAVTFMLQHKLGLHNNEMPCHQLPSRMEENCRDFTGFVHRQIKTHNVPLSAVGAMDELSIFVDFDQIVNCSGSSKDSAFQLEGTGKPWMNIYLSVLADGTLLPTMLFIKGMSLDSFSKELSDLVQIKARVEGFSEKEELEIWSANVWQRYLNSHNENKAMLVIDGHHSHMTEGFLSTLNGTQTLPMVIPSGCSSQRQPLEMCVRPALKKFLLCRWSHLVIQNRTGEMKPEGLVQLLVSWLEEALACCSGRPQVIQHSFCHSRLITNQEECNKDTDAQLKLLNTLTEAMLGPEVINSVSKEEAIEKHVEGILEKREKVINGNKSGVEQAEREILGETENESKTESERMETKQQAQATTNEGLEVSSETSKCSPLLPDNSSQSQAVHHVNEREELLEPCQDLVTTQTDVGSSC